MQVHLVGVHGGDVSVGPFVDLGQFAQIDVEDGDFGTDVEEGFGGVCA